MTYGGGICLLRKTFEADRPDAVLMLGLVDTVAVAHLSAALRVMAVPAPLLTGLARSLAFN